MNQSKASFTVNDVAACAMMACVLFVQKEALSFIPDVSLTVLLMIVYSICLGFRRASLIILAYTLLDNLVWGSFNVIYTPFMIVGWMLIPICTCTIFRKVRDPIALAFVSLIYSLVYCWLFIIPQVFILHVEFWQYLLADLPWEGVFAASNFVAVLLLSNPVIKLIDKYCPVSKARLKEQMPNSLISEESISGRGKK